MDKTASAGKTRVYDLPGSGIEDRLKRYDPARRRAVEMRQHLADLAGLGELLPAELGKHEEAGKRADKLERCGCWLKLHEYFTRGQTRLVDARFCCQPLLCPLCAIRRASKFMRAYVERLVTVLHECPQLRPYLVTLTVANGPDLAERFGHLRRSLSKLAESRRHAINGQSGTWSEAVRAVAGVGSIEIKRGNGSDLWHPHYHAVWLCQDEPDALALSDEWKRITGDSFVVDVRPFHCAPDLGKLEPAGVRDAIAGDFVEVAKYALKFSSLTLADNWHAFRLLSGRRLVDAFGFLRGVQVDESLLDEPLDDTDAPYLEIVAKWRGTAYECERGRLMEPAEVPGISLDSETAEAVALAEASFCS